MNIKILYIVVLLILCTFFINTALADIWTTNSSMKSGILYTIGDGGGVYHGDHMVPTTFIDDGYQKVFFGASWPVGEKRPGICWKWTGSSWTEDTDMVNGLSDSDNFRPEIFTFDDTLYMIGGTGYSGAPDGWKWSGSQWDSYSLIANGLPHPKTETFVDSGILKAISYTGTSGSGYYWDNSQWIEDTNIVSGLTFSPEKYGIAIFQVGDILNLIQEDYTNAEFDGYYWSGSTWIENSTISSGITYSDAIHEIEVFVLNGKYQAITGSYSGGSNIFAFTDGDYLAPTPPITPTPTETEPPIYIPPPVLPPTPVPIPPPEEPVLEIIIEEFIDFISTSFNWILIFLAYFGALLGKILSDPDNDNTYEILVDTLLYGTIACIIILIINFVVPIITMEKFLVMFIFALIGFIIASLANIDTQPKKRSKSR